MKRKNKMLPQQYYRATTLIQNLGWISRGDSSNLYGGKMWVVTPKGRTAYCHALSVSNEISLASLNLFIVSLSLSINKL